MSLQHLLAWYQWYIFYCLSPPNQTYFCVSVVYNISLMLFQALPENSWTYFIHVIVCLLSELNNNTKFCFLILSHKCLISSPAQQLVLWTNTVCCICLCVFIVWVCWVSAADGCPYILPCVTAEPDSHQYPNEFRSGPCASLQTSFGMQMKNPNKANLSEESNLLTAAFEDTQPHSGLRTKS